jgi:TonB family protein
MIRNRIQALLHYPISLQRRRIQGTTTLELKISEAGQLEQAQIQSTSGSPELDQLALEAAREAQPFPSHGTSDTKKMGKLKISLPIEFVVR